MIPPNPNCAKCGIKVEYTWKHISTIKDFDFSGMLEICNNCWELGWIHSISNRNFELQGVRWDHPTELYSKAFNMWVKGDMP